MKRTDRLAREVDQAFQAGDSLMDDLERRVIALEEVVAAPWPRRILAAWRLGRTLRASVAPFGGDGFYWRRIESATNEWLWRLQEHEGEKRG